MRLLIREFRLQRGMTLKELGETIGRKPHTVWEYEQHKIRIPASVLYDIAQALGVSLNELCAEDDLPPPPTPRAAVHALPPRRSNARRSRAEH